MEFDHWLFMPEVSNNQNIRMQEIELLSGLNQNKQEAFRQLIELYQDKIFRVCYGLLQNHEDAEEIAQDVFVEVYRSIQKFKGDSSLSTWLYRIAVNKSLNQIKKNKSKSWLVFIDTLFPQSEQDAVTKGSFTPGPDRILERKESAGIVEDILNKLPENQRIAFTLHKYEDLPHKQIAEIMSVSVPSVESLIFRAKENIKKKYSDKLRR